MTDEELKRRLSDLEDGWTERKEKGVSTDDIRKAIVAFANSVPDGEEAVLFVGVADDGKITGVDNPEKTQKSFSKTASEWCYPPVKHTARVIEVSGNYVVAVIVQASHDKPHFAGPAFIRSGSQSKNASPEAFSQLIASRNSKARPLLELMRKGEKVTVFYWAHGRSNKLLGCSPLPDCTIIECTPHYAVFQPLAGTPVSGDYDRITLSKNLSTNQLQVDIDN
ncbi:MAG: ATP-binding protein [Acidobacteria bacterium]|nr:ATP-binding protein [Acidobacteriota bacterium]